MAKYNQQELIESLVRLESNDDFQTVVSHFKSECENSKDNALIQDGVSLSRTQGKGAFIKEFLDLITKSRDVVNSKV